MFAKRLKEIAQRKKEIRKMLKGSEPVDMDALEQELDDLEKEERELQRREAATRRLNGTGEGEAPAGSEVEEVPGAVNPILGRGGTTGTNPERNFDPVTRRMAELQGIEAGEVEERARSFASSGHMEIPTAAVHRSLTLSSGELAQPTRVSGINPGQNVVSGLVDMVYVVDADGMGEDAVAYEVSGGQTANTAKDDGKDAEESTPFLKVAKITPTLVTTPSYVSRRIQRTTPLNYQNRVIQSAFNALRQKVGGLIVNGDPAATIPEPTGIIKAAAISAGSDMEISAIDEKTLRSIALNYGGAANVEGGGVLLLNKATLIAFGDVRGEKEKKAVYEIIFSENSSTTGTIKDGGLSVRFCIVDDLPAFSSATTGKYVMVYGKPLAYQLDLFGPYTVEVSKDFQFAKGLLAVMGEALVGGNVITENGFIRVKKKAGGAA
ncbi:MAG: phage major capsid protein [Acutalibacter sp.]|nr:phage major capsid protein [Acutalibacter sp.]